MVKNKLGMYLKINKMTQEDLANITGIPKATISRYISGRTNPSVESAIKIADCLKTDVKNVWQLVKK